MGKCVTWGAWVKRLAYTVGIFLGAASFGGPLQRVANTSLRMPETPPSSGSGYIIQNAFGSLTFSQPVGIVTAPGDNSRVFILEKSGRIQVVTNLAQPNKTLFLDLSSRTLTSREDGLLGLAFHPGWRTNGFIYVFYNTTDSTALGSGLHDRLSRFSISSTNPNQALASSEVPLISQYDRYDTHNAGSIHFGPDGYLYVSLGDEGGGGDQYGNSQKINKNFFSAIMRIDVDRRSGNLAPNPHPASRGNYSIPADNPYIGATSFNGIAVDPAQVRTEFWAVGFRNPWRMAFDYPTGRLYVGDVGQDTREEVDVVVRGGNYGWTFREGNGSYRGTPPAGVTLTDPILSYSHGGNGSSVTGGVVYRGSRMPELVGEYIFGDYNSGHVWALRYDGSTASNWRQLVDASGPVAFGTDPSNGDVLIAEISSGRIQRLLPAGSSSGPAMPLTLADTGAFSDLASLTPYPGIVAYDVNVPFWSDNARKQRWFSVPNLQQKITFHPDNNWSFPTGTVWIKHFDLEMTNGVPSSARRLETRFLVRNNNGVYGVTYRWNGSQSNADLVPADGSNETFVIRDGSTTRTQVWRYPSRSECLVCHNQVSGWADGFSTAQLNRAHDYNGISENQIRALSDAGYFTTPVTNTTSLQALARADDESATLEHRGRSFLAANCLQCHQPGGTGQGTWDARISTPMESAGIIDGPLANYNGDTNNRVLKPGSIANSMLHTRISSTGPLHMPPLGSSLLDQASIDLLARWITNSAPPPSPTPPSITSQPQSQTVNVGSTVTFSVGAAGSTPYSYQWRKAGAPISGANSASYTIQNVQTSHAGSYDVIVSNAAGAVTSSPATLTVNAPQPPTITSQPQSQTINQGSTATFSVAATGSGNLQYQWRKDNVTVTGATSATYSIANVQPTHAGNYDVVVSNSAGSVTSGSATLTVNATPPPPPPPSATNGPIIIDHTSVEQYASIPQSVIDQIKTMWLNLPGGSRGKAYAIGGNLLQQLDPRFRIGHVESGAPEPATSDHLRFSQLTWGDLVYVNRWRNAYRADAWFINDRASTVTRTHLAYCNTNGLPISAFGFQWSGEMLSSVGGGMDTEFGTRWGGDSTGGPDGDLPWGLDDADAALTGNRINLDTYLRVTQAYADFCRTNGFSTKVFFTTDSVEGSSNLKESGYQRHLKNERIRNYVRNSPGEILFDYADILCWSDGGSLSTTSWSGNGVPRTFPLIHPDNMLDVNGSYTDDGDRIGQRGALRLAKAMWVMLGRMSGWDPAQTSTSGGLQSASGIMIDAQADAPGTAVVDGRFTFGFMTQPGTIYVMEYKNSLADTEWKVLAEIEGVGARITVNDPDQVEGTRFYRVRQKM